MRRWTITSLLAAVLGLACLAIGALVDLDAALAAYLTSFCCALTIGLGCLLLVIIAHATGARWMLLYRRLAELGAATLFVLAPAFLPILLGAPRLYDWAAPLDRVPRHLHHAIEHKHAWLNLPFFGVRALAYFALWIVISEILLRFSLRQDPGVPRTTARLSSFAAASIWPMVLTLTFATFDFFMSLDVQLYSSIYPVYFFAGSILAALALVGLISSTVRELNPSHLHALGKLELTFVIFWAYIAFCQLMLIWIADLPPEVAWLLPRMTGVWGALGVALIVGHFAIPFFLLLSRRLKRRRTFINAIGVWLLFIHWIDVVWFIAPSGRTASLHSLWLQPAALLFFAGLLSATALFRAHGRPLLAHADPRFPDALRYRTR